MKAERDITNEADVRELVARFYNVITKDAVIGHFFIHLDLAAHLPRIEAFWCMVLFGDRTYNGEPMSAHIALDRRHQMEPPHFDRWLSAWDASVNELFRGEKAENNTFKPDKEAIDILAANFIDSGKPVLSVDYINEPKKIAEFYGAAIEHGFLPYAAPARQLNIMAPPYDGSAEAVA